MGIIFSRKRIRLESWDYSNSGYYFVTVCTKNGDCLFGDIVNGVMDLSEYGIIAESELVMIPTRYDNVDVDKYIVMPNHVHMIVGINGSVSGNKKADLPNIVGKYKAGVTRAVGNAFMRSQQIWQRRYYDHIIRNEKDYWRVSRIIDENVYKWAEDEYYEKPNE
jgi:REP element-mobilizing transposase RayT